MTTRRFNHRSKFCILVSTTFLLSAGNLAGCAVMDGLDSGPGKLADEADVVEPLPDAAPSAPGSISGKITFAMKSTFTVVEVKVLDCDTCRLSNGIDEQGQFRFEDVPPGDWSVVASAPYYPAQTIGPVSVTSGNDSALPDYEMSLYRPLLHPDNIPGTFKLLGRAQRASYLNKQAGILVFEPADASHERSLFAFDYNTASLHPLPAGDEPVLLSPGGEYYMTLGASKVAAVLLSSGAREEFTVSRLLTDIHFMHDSDTFVGFEETGGAHLAHIVRPAPSPTPSSAFSYERVRFTSRVDTAAGAIFLRLSNPDDPNAPAWVRVDSAGTTPIQGLDGVDQLRLAPSPASLDLNPIAYGFARDCASSSCILYVLAPGAVQAQAIHGHPISPAQDVFRVLASQGTWLAVQSDSDALLINTTDATTLQLSDVDLVTFSPNARRVIYTTSTGQLFLRELTTLPSNAPVLIRDHPGARYIGAWITSELAHFADNEPDEHGQVALYHITGNEQPSTINKYVPGSLIPFFNIGTITRFYDSAGTQISIEFPDAQYASRAPLSSLRALAAGIRLQRENGDVRIRSNPRMLLTWDNGDTWFIRGSEHLRTVPNLTYHDILLGHFLRVQGAGGYAYFMDFDTDQRIQPIEHGIDSDSIDYEPPALLSDKTLIIAQRALPDGANQSVFAILPAFATE